MKMSVKMTVLFSIIAAVMIAVNSVLAVLSELENMRLHEKDNLTAIADKMVAAIEQNISIMEYAIEEMNQDLSFMAALNTIYVLGENGENTAAYHQAQNVLSSALFHEPLNDNFYRVNVMTREGFFLSSHFEKVEVIENYSDEIRDLLFNLPWLNDENMSLSQKLIVGPHPDPWNISRPISVYSLVAPAVYHGKQIGFLEVNATTDDLNDIFSSTGISGFRASAIFDNGRELHRGAGDTIAYASEGADAMTSCTDAAGVTYYVVSSASKWLGLTVYAAQRVDSYMSSIRSVILYHTGISLSLLVVAVLSISLLSFRLTRSIRLLTQKVSHTSTEPLSAEHPLPSDSTAKVTWPGDREVRELENVFDNQLIQLKTAMRNDAALRESNLKSQLNALQAQINPHFVYNTLNIISAKSMEAGNEEIIEICERFAQMLRYSTDLRGKTATLAEEIAHVRNYLTLVKARYEDKLDYLIDVPEAFSTLLLPKLSLQPMAENAISHGYQGSCGSIRISISGAVDAAGDLHLFIRDNGRGFDGQVLSHLREEFARIESGELLDEENATAHIGLINTYRRLFYFSHGKIRMLIRNEQGAIIELIVRNPHKEVS